MNSFFTLSSALVSAVSLVTGEVAPEVMVGRHPLVRGTLHGGHALVYGQIESPGRLPDGGWSRAERTRLELTRRPGGWAACSAILRTALSGGQPELIDLSGLVGSHWPTRPGLVPLRWHQAGGVLYHTFCCIDDNTRFNGGKPRPGSRLEGPNGSICRVPLTAPVLAACRVDPKGEGPDRIAARMAVLNEVKARHWLVWLDPVDERFGPAGVRLGLRRPEPELWRTHFDFHTHDGKAFELFVAAPDGLAVHRPALAPPAETANSKEMTGWRLVSTHPPAWVGPFYVAADGGDRHFVVPGGRVFSLPADAPPGSALVKTWDNGPLLALVHDADAGKSYAFTRTHYFHLTAKPDPKPHALKAFPGATGEEALDTVAKCGRVLRGLK